MLRNKARCQHIILVTALLLISISFPLASSVADGTQMWIFETQGAIKGSPAIGPNGTIYAGSDDGSLYAINPDGTTKWAFETENPVESPPAIGSDGTIYLCASGKLYALSPDGAVKWSFDADGLGISNGTPALSEDGTIYVGGLGKVYALNPDGTQQWSYETGNLPNASPAIGPDGTIYIGSENGNLYAISRTSAPIRATRAAPWVETSNPDVDVSGQGATLKGILNPNGEETTYWFEWGYSTSYGNTTTQTTISNSTSFQTVSAYIDESGSGLDFTKTYHYRLVASNASGTTRGADVSFTASQDSFGGNNCFITTARYSPYKASLLLLVLVLLLPMAFIALWQAKKEKGEK